MNVGCDLDGVIYRGATVIPGVPEALGRLAGAGATVFFITNNSTRTPDATAEKISRLTGIEVGGDQVLSSALAAATMLEPDDGPVFVIGEEGVHAAAKSVGLTITEDPMLARTVMVGLTRRLTYEWISQAMLAVRNGARFIATNDDATFPTEDGLAPGCGAIVAAIQASSETEPEVAGKPNAPMRDLIRSRFGNEAWIIGDRLDTDVALTRHEPGWSPIVVLTGITSRKEAESAGVELVVDDFAAAVDLVLSTTR